MTKRNPSLKIREIELMLLGEYFTLLYSFVADNQREIDSYKKANK